MRQICGSTLTGSLRSARRWSGIGLLAGIFLSLRLADATPSPPMQLARGIKVEVVDNTAVVSRGAVRAPLLRTSVFDFALDPDSQQLQFQLDNCWTFGEREQTDFTLDALEARLENAAALTHHRAGRYHEAAVGFRRALKLDPSYLLSVYNLASALNAMKQSAEAATVLSPYLARNVAKVYLAVLKDPELVSLLNQPSLAAVRALTPGTAILRAWDADWVAYSAKHALVAVLDPHDGLRIFALKTGALQAVLNVGNRVPQWSGDGSSGINLPAIAKKQEAVANRVFEQQQPLIKQLLFDLGFVDARPRLLGKREENPAGEDTWSFAGSSLRVVAAEGVPKLVQAERTIAQAEGFEPNRLNKVILLPKLNTIVWQWRRNHGPTDCHRQRGTEVLVPLATPSGRAR